MKKNDLMLFANSKGLSTSYSGITKTLFVKGNTSESFVKKFTPDTTGHVRDSKGHFIKGGLGFKVQMM